MERLISLSDNALSVNLNEVLSKLLLPDTNVIEKATVELRELNKNSSFVPSLFSVLCQSDDAEIRKLASVIFRRKVTKQWKTFNRDICNGVRDAILERILVESNKKVSQSLCQVAASIAKHELSQVDGTWSNLFDLICRGVEQDDSRETAVYLLSVVCDQVNEKLEPHFINLLKLLNGILENNNKDDTEIYAVKAFDSLVPYLGDEYVNLVRPLVLKCVAVIQRLLEVDEDRAADLMEIFETLIETEVSFISPYVKDLVLFSLQIASKSDFEDMTRVRALSTLRWIIKLKKKSIIKLGLVEPILNSVIPIVTSPCDEDEICLDSDEVESELPLSSATYVMQLLGYCGASLGHEMVHNHEQTQIVDELALHLSPEKLYKVLMPKIEALTQSDDPCHRRGLVLILACLAEGTSEYIKNNYLKTFLEIVCRASLDDNPAVRNASLFAIGQFSEHLQPNINEFATDVMPLLFQILQKTPESSKGITRAYYALENFVESLEDKILPYLEQVISHLLMTLSNCEKIHTRELAVSSIGAVANAAKENLLPYLGEILSKLTRCLPTNSVNGTENGHSEEDTESLGLLHMQTLDTLGVLARSVGKENFLPLAEDCLKLGMSILEGEEKDPDMNRSAYGLFSAITTIVEEKMSPYLNPVVKHMLDSIRSTEGVVPHFVEETNGEAMTKDFSFLDDSVDQDNDDDDDDIEGFSVGNSYMDEKSDACEAIGEIAKNTKEAFLPYLQMAFEEVFSLVDFPHPDVRKAAIGSSGELTMCAYKLKHESYPKFLSVIFPVICKTIVKETERLVVMGAIATANQMVACCGVDCFAKGDNLEELMKALLMITVGKSACQDSEDDVDDEQQDWLQAEYDEMLIEYSGEILPVLAKSLGAATFLPYFAGFLPALVAKMKSTCTTTERSFSAGTVAETFQRLGPGSSKQFVAHIIPRFLELAKDSHDEIRNNSIFGIGVVLQQAEEEGVQFYPSALNLLSQILSVEKSRGIIDNILGAVARMIATNKASVPIAQVVPVLLSHLPIEKDHDEDATVYSCLSYLLHDDLDAAVKVQIISLFVKVIEMEKVEQDIKISLINELRSTQQRDPSLISQACEAIGKEMAAKLQMALS